MLDIIHDFQENQNYRFSIVELNEFEDMNQKCMWLSLKLEDWRYQEGMNLQILKEDNSIQVKSYSELKNSTLKDLESAINKSTVENYSEISRALGLEPRNIGEFNAQLINIKMNIDNIDKYVNEINTLKGKLNDQNNKILKNTEDYNKLMEN